MFVSMYVKLSVYNYHSSIFSYACSYRYVVNYVLHGLQRTEIDLCETITTWACSMNNQKPKLCRSTSYIEHIYQPLIVLDAHNNLLFMTIMAIHKELKDVHVLYEYKFVCEL